MATSDRTEPEVWRPIPGLPDYEASSLGQIRCLGYTYPVRRWGHVFMRRYGPRVLKPKPSGRRYLWFRAWVDAKPRHVYIHHAVALAFHGPRPLRRGVLHRDDNPANNAVSNLYYGSAQDNARDRIRNGHQPRGEELHAAKLTEADIPEIRRLSADGVPQLEIAGRFGISVTVVSRIKDRHAWRHVP